MEALTLVVRRHPAATPLKQDTRARSFSGKFGLRRPEKMPRHRWPGQENEADEQQFPLYPEYPTRGNASRMKSCLMTSPVVR
jgi:hypothetical protein